MNLEIHQPELVARVNAHIQAGHFHDVDELLTRALDALEQQEPGVAQSEAELPLGKDIEQLFAPLRGLNPDFSRNPSTGRPVDL